MEFISIMFMDYAKIRFTYPVSPGNASRLVIDFWFPPSMCSVVFNDLRIPVVTFFSSSRSKKYILPVKVSNVTIDTTMNGTKSCLRIFQRISTYFPSFLQNNIRSVMIWDTLISIIPITWYLANIERQQLCVQCKPRQQRSIEYLSLQHAVE